MTDSDQPDAMPIDPALRQRLTPLYRAGQVVGCVSSVAHDVNNGLGAILAYAELVQQSESLTDETRRMIGNIIKSVQKCSSLVTALTTVSRKERPDVNLVFIPEFLDQVLDLRRHEFRSNRIGLELNCADQMPSMIVDRPKLMMALLYLLSNAVDAAQGTEKARVVVSAAVVGDCVEIAVKDSGPGISQDVSARMFDPFFSTKDEQHLGLGLTLAREIAAFHGGQLRHDDHKGFVITLPLASRLKI